MSIGFVMESDGILSVGHSILESDECEQRVVEAIGVGKQEVFQCLEVSDGFNAKRYALSIELIKI